MNKIPFLLPVIYDSISTQINCHCPGNPCVSCCPKNLHALVYDKNIEPLSHFVDKLMEAFGITHLSEEQRRMDYGSQPNSVNYWNGLGDNFVVELPPYNR